jgi:hypothetical protein
MTMVNKTVTIEAPEKATSGDSAKMVTHCARVRADTYAPDEANSVAATQNRARV